MTKSAKECSMCGDIGFSHELFRCRKCLHRSQHTYCSMLYLKTESYEVCDWCLRAGEDREVPSCDKRNVSESRCIRKCITVRAADDEKKRGLRAYNDCQRSLPDQQAIRIIKQKSIEKTDMSVSTAVLVHSSTQKLETVKHRSSQIGICAKGREFLLNERITKQREDNILHGQNRKPNSVGAPRKEMSRVNAKSRMRNAKVSSPRLFRGKVRRYKLLEEVSS